MTETCQNCFHRHGCPRRRLGGLCDWWDAESTPRATIMLAWVMTLTGLTVLGLVVWINL